MISCPLCGDDESIHVKEMDRYHELFMAEYCDLKMEHSRLEALFRQVVWYNFETVARTWRFPWPETMMDSKLVLHGTRFEKIKTRGGRDREKGSFPVYYSGSVRNAPTLPPEVVLAEVKAAFKDVQEAEERLSDPYEWAPGGRKYEQMLRESDGVQMYCELRNSSDHSANEPHTTE